MRKSLSCLSVVAASMLLSACIYPLGMSEAEWNSLTPDQQYQARLKQAKIDEEQRKRWAAERARQQKIELEQQKVELAKQKREAARVRQLRNTADYGDIMQCIIREPTVDFKPGWRRAETVSFSIVRTEVQKHTLRTPNGRKSTDMWAKLEGDGVTLRICEKDPHKRGLKYCDTMAALSAEYRVGARHTLKLPNLMQGTVHCAYGMDRHASDRDRREWERERWLQLERERAQREADRRYERYDEPRYGDVMRCAIREPMVDFRPGWHRAEDVTFSIERMELQQHTLRSLNGRKSISMWAMLEDDGKTLRICRRDPVKRGYRYCDTVRGRAEDFTTGVRHTLDLPDLMRGTVSCAYGPADTRYRY